MKTTLQVPNGGVRSARQHRSPSAIGSGEADRRRRRRLGRRRSGRSAGRWRAQSGKMNEMLSVIGTLQLTDRQTIDHVNRIHSVQRVLVEHCII